MIAPIPGEPGWFLDLVTNQKISIREWRMDDKYDTVTIDPRPWWTRVRDSAKQLASRIARGGHVSAADTAIVLLEIQELCAELDVYKSRWDETLEAVPRARALQESREKEIARLQRKLARRGRRRKKPAETNSP